MVLKTDPEWGGDCQPQPLSLTICVSDALDSKRSAELRKTDANVHGAEGC